MQAPWPKAIAYRGPDGADVWSDAERGIALSHRRLAIVDLTPTGAQPMVSADGRWVISYNGEVYNAEAIAASPALAGLTWRGTSDTEVILESLARRGLDPTLDDLNGMFAMALWDRATETLHLVRDRLGIKPLFYAQKKRFYFASELKSFAAAGLTFDIDPASVASFYASPMYRHRSQYIATSTKVLPGEVVSIGPGGRKRRRKYWDLGAVAAAGLANQFTGSDADAEASLSALLADAVSAQMSSDVPLRRISVRGGIDSSTVDGFDGGSAARALCAPFRSVFPDFGYDRSIYARAVAHHLGTMHEELIVTAADALSVVPQLCRYLRRAVLQILADSHPRRF